MHIIKIRNFVPMQGSDFGDWAVCYKEGEYFKASCTSRDGNVTCEYYIDANYERLVTVAVDKYKFPYEKKLKNDKKPVYNNDGNGVIRLTGGWVSNRYGYFRKANFQEFLDKFDIDSISKMSGWQFRNIETTYIISEDGDKLYIPEGSTVTILNGRYSISSHCKMILTPRGKFTIASVSDAEFWIHEQIKNGQLVRRLYVNKDKIKNITTLDKKIKELLA